MARLTSVCVYCGSASGANPAYTEAARTLGRMMAEREIALVYGGGSIGLMGEVARAVLAHGGKVVGIIPRFLLAREELMPGLTETVVTEDMHQRKMLMFDRADAFVALPGGVGTLEELVEQMTWAQLGRHQKPVLLANINGFWDALVRLLEQMRREGFIRYGLEVSCLIADRAEEVVPMLIEAAARRPEAELEKTAAEGALSRM